MASVMPSLFDAIIFFCTTREFDVLYTQCVTLGLEFCA